MEKVITVSNLNKGGFKSKKDGEWVDKWTFDFEGDEYVTYKQTVGKMLHDGVQLQVLFENVNGVNKVSDAQSVSSVTKEGVTEQIPFSAKQTAVNFVKDLIVSGYPPPEDMWHWAFNEVRGWAGLPVSDDVGHFEIKEPITIEVDKEIEELQKGSSPSKAVEAAKARGAKEIEQPSVEQFYELCAEKLNLTKSQVAKKLFEGGLIKKSSDVANLDRIAAYEALKETK